MRSHIICFHLEIRKISQNYPCHPFLSGALITITEAVYIWDLQEEYTFSIGSTVDITCKADGLPEPIFWWTKESDETFERSGYRLIEENVQVKSFFNII